MTSRISPKSSALNRVALQFFDHNAVGMMEQIDLTEVEVKGNYDSQGPSKSW